MTSSTHFLNLPKNIHPKDQRRLPAFYDPLPTIRILPKWIRRVIWRVVCVSACLVEVFLRVKLPPVLLLLLPLPSATGIMVYHPLLALYGVLYEVLRTRMLLL